VNRIAAWPLARSLQEDRFNRMEKRGIIPSAGAWRSLRDLRNSIVHDYLIESSDEVLSEAHRRANELFDAVKFFLRDFFAFCEEVLKKFRKLSAES